MEMHEQIAGTNSQLNGTNFVPKSDGTTTFRMDIVDVCHQIMSINKVCSYECRNRRDY